MGWTYHHYKRHNVIDELKSHWPAEHFEIKKAAIVKFRTAYMAITRKDINFTFAAVYLLDYRDGGFGYKDMDETVGPYESDCPESILKLLTPIAEYERVTGKEYSRHAQGWRDACWEKVNKRKAANAKVDRGAVIRFANPINFGSHGTFNDFIVDRSPRGKQLALYIARQTQDGSWVKQTWARVTDWKHKEFERIGTVGYVV